MLQHLKRNASYFSLLVTVGIVQAAPGDASIATWKNNKTAALSFTIDDGIQGPTEKFQAAFSSHNVKGTFSINNYQQYWTVPWSTIQQLAQSGHEIANHTSSHVAATSANFSTEVVAFNTTLQTQSGVKPVTFIYPFGTTNADVKTMLASSGFISARGVIDAHESKTPSDWYNLKTKVVASGQTANTWNPWVDQVLSSGGWCIELWHNVDNEGQWANVSGSEMTSHVAYAAGKSNLWIETLAGVTKYAKERDVANVQVTGKSTEEYTFTLTDPLENTTYNAPITVMIEVSGWSFASATQNGQSIEASVTTIGGVPYALVNAIPDAGTVTVVKSTSNSGGGTNTSSSSSISSSSSSGSSIAFDDFEDGDNVNQFGGYWYAFTDVDNGGLSTVTFSTEGNGFNSANAASAEFTFHKGTYAYNGFIGLGVNWVATEGTTVDIRSTTGITFSYKGSANRLVFQSSDVTDFDYYGYDLPATSTWTTVTIPWSSFSQGGWGVAKSSIALDKAVSLAWQATDADNVSGSLSIDNIQIVGTVNLPTVKLTPSSLYIRSEKSIQTRPLSNGSIEVFASSPIRSLEIRDIQGQLIYSANLNGKYSSVIQLPQGLHTLRSPGFRSQMIRIYP